MSQTFDTKRSPACKTDVEDEVVSVLRRWRYPRGRGVCGRDYGRTSVEARYAFEGGIIRGWDLQSRNMDVLWVVRRKTVRVLNIGDDLHAIWGRGLYIQRQNDVVQGGDGEPCWVLSVPRGGLTLGW